MKRVRAPYGPEMRVTVWSQAQHLGPLTFLFVVSDCRKFLQLKENLSVKSLTKGVPYGAYAQDYSSF
jgi:hypothetical protein